MARAPRTPRDRILSAALSVFAAHGERGSSVQDVATRAGMSKQALLHHFPTKERLLDGVYGLLAERFRAELPEVATELVSRSHDRYRAIIEVALDRFVDSPELARFLAFELLERPATVLGWLRSEASPWLGLVKGVVEQSSERQEGFDPEAHVAVLGAMMLMQSTLAQAADPAWRRRLQQATLRVMQLGSHLSPTPAPKKKRG